MKKVGIIAGSISRFDNPKHTLQEEMCAEAVKMILDDVPDLEFGYFRKAMHVAVLTSVIFSSNSVCIR